MEKPIAARSLAEADELIAAASAGRLGSDTPICKPCGGRVLPLVPRRVS